MGEMESSSDEKCPLLRSHRREGTGHDQLKWTTMWTLLLVLSDISTVSGTITVINQLTNESVAEFVDAPASFVPERVSYYGLRGYVVYADPPNACHTVQPTPNVTTSVNWILVARRLDCDFQTKIENAQNMGYSAIIIHNVGSNRTEPMNVKDPERLVIYAAFIGEHNGLLLRDNYSITASNYEYYIAIEDDFAFSGYILPFAIVVSICFVVMLLFMVRLVWQQVCRWLQERRRSRRRKLPNSVLKKLPITKWTKGDPYETCAVCLEDFIEQDKVRVLPCSHGFHAVCIDPWLTKNRRVCPICKRKVILAEERFSDSDSDSEDETTPLLRNPSTSNPNPATSSSTFVQRGDSLFRVRRHPLLHRTPRQEPTMPHIPGHSTREAPNSSDNSSISSTDSDGQRTQSHQSLPVLAEVHGSSLGQSTEVPQGSRAPFPSLQTLPSVLNSSYHHQQGGRNAIINLDPVDVDGVSDSGDSSVEAVPESIIIGGGGDGPPDIPAVHIPIVTSTGGASSNNPSNPNRNAIV